ncbi:MAG: carbohydrate kinase family protein [Betaproteobacteria bacterium]|nr:carbohydrate kinase family protein [Betaproteobacteria bacterium]MDE2423266.1 carbohydrate kinase family protein [Betaproteobacteria bacterium]
MTTLVCGSMAYDTIMVFEDRFQHHILPEKIHSLSVAFLVPTLRKEFGGTAGNIAYNLNLLETNPLIMATVGHDFTEYHQRLESLNISTQHIRQLSDSFTAQAFITTDLDDNQITAFHPGAMNFSHLNHVKEAQNVTFGVVSPDGKTGMIEHAKAFHQQAIPFLFDPGQGLPMFSGEELLTFIEQATYFAVNDYEAQLLVDKTGLAIEELAKRVDAAIVTRGAEGSTIYTDNETIHIPAVRAENIIDPTGCGDAYRAGLIYGITHQWSWAKTGRLAALMGSLKIGHRGGQNHRYTFAEIASLFKQQFDLDLDT